MITIASLMGLMMVGSALDFSGALDEGGESEDDITDGDPDGGEAEARAFGFGFDDLLAGAVPTDVFVEFGDEMHSYYEDEAACDALADGALGEAGPVAASTLDDWLAMTDGTPTLIEDYDETEDALFVVYDAAAHPDPVLSVGPSDTGDDDAMILLDGIPLAVVSGGAGLDLGMVELVPEVRFPMALAAGA